MTTEQFTAAIPPVNILLVDDEVRNLDALESFLVSPDYRLVRALSAQKALLLLLEGDFAAIVLDVQMPTMSGIELANLIKQRKRTQHIPIIFLTAYFQEDKDVLEGYGIGAVDYLTKPINPQILKSKLSVFVDLFRKTHALAASNAALELEVAQRQGAEEALRQVNNGLERRVQERTADLSRLNEELQRREAALRASEAQAQAASQAKDDFLAALSHELRTPLNPVLLLASDAGSNMNLPPAIRADFEMIRKNIHLEARLIDDLLDLTSITRGKLRLEEQRCDIQTILQDAVAHVQADLQEKRQQLDSTLDPIPGIVWGDSVRLQQIFWNILKNAVKFTPDEGRIGIHTQHAPGGDMVMIRIFDSGIGMTPEEIDRVFQAFSQGDHAVTGTGSRRFGGLGLGLAISKMLVELHGGRIQALSEGRNHGSTFVVELPLGRKPGSSANPLLPASAEPFQATSASQPPMPTARTPIQGARQRILLVEDHAPTRQTLEQLLRNRNYEVVSAESADEAQRLAIARGFDLLISDVGLPDRTGYELMVELRSIYPHLAGIALSGYGMEDDLAQSRAAGFSEHLVKPVTMGMLEDAIARLSLTAMTAHTRPTIAG